MSIVELGLGFDNNRVACFSLVISFKAIAANSIMTSSIGCCTELLLGSKDHCTTAGAGVLGLVTYLGVIGCTSKQVPNPSSHPLGTLLDNDFCPPLPPLVKFEHLEAVLL